MRESPYLELVSVWTSISPEEQLEALLAHRGLVNAVEPGLWEQLRDQRKEQEEAAREQRKIDLETARAEAAEAKAIAKAERKAASDLARRQRAIPVEIRKIENSLCRLDYRDGVQQRRLEKTREKLAKHFIKQIKRNPNV